MAGVIAYFTPDATTATSAGPSASAIALPGTPASDTCACIVNFGPMPAAVQLFATQPSGSTLAACTMATGLVVMPGQSQLLGISGKTYITLTTGTPGTSATVNITTGS